MTNRRLTARQLTKALAEIDVQIEALRVIAQAYADTFGDTDIPTPVYDAWNATNSAIEALEFKRAEVEANPRPIPAGEYETWLLVKANID